MIRMTTVTPSTSVILIDTKTGLSPYIVYFPYNSNVGNIITVRDNSGYASTGNVIILSTLNRVSFPDNNNTITINQPYGFITLSSENNGYYSILNTFAFPTGSESAYVYNVNTDIIGIKDKTTSNFEYLTMSTGILYYGSNNVGNVTTTELASNINFIDNKFTTTINSSLIVRRYIAVGNSGIPDVSLGSIQYSDNSIDWNNALGGTQGFFNGGIDVTVKKDGFYVACGNNYNTNEPNNLGYLQWSTDGLIWNNSFSPVLSSDILRSRVNYANGLWHAVGTGSDSNSILWSSDGKTWNPSIDSSNIFSGTGFNSIVYGKNVWVACGFNLNHSAYSMIYSTDGSNWNPNVSINTILKPFYDITYTGKTFIALARNTSLTGNIVLSIDGRTDSSIINTNFNNEAGFVAANDSIVLAVTNNFHKYSINFGYTWNNISNFPAGNPGRPHYDGSLWWVGINNGTSSNLFYSTTGSNLWINTYLNSVFNNSYPTNITSLNVSSNLNVQLISTVAGLETTFNTINFGVSTISTGSFSIYTTDDTNESILNIDNSKNGYILTSSIYTKYINTSSIYTDYIEIPNFTTNNINASTIYTNEFVSNELYSSTINFSSFYTTSIFVDNISTNSINVPLISSSVIYSEEVNTDIISTNVLRVSTLNLIDGLNGSLSDINTNNGNLFFNGEKLLTAVGTNPLYFTFQLQDNSTPDPGAIPGGPGFFTVDTDNTTTLSVINFSITDYNNISLIGFFNRVGIYSILYIINPTTLKTSAYLIQNIKASVNLQYYTLTLVNILGTSQILNAGPPGEIYNFYIGNIGIKPPPSSPTDTVVVKVKKITGTSFDFDNAIKTVPAEIGEYYGNPENFSIRLNSLNYNLNNIPATLGSITYFDGNEYLQVNVKYGSISESVGAAIIINEDVSMLTLNGLTTTNFNAENDVNNYAIYITIKFLN